MMTEVLKRRATTALAPNCRASSVSRSGAGPRAGDFFRSWWYDEAWRPSSLTDGGHRNRSQTEGSRDAVPDPAASGRERPGGHDGSQPSIPGSLP